LTAAEPRGARDPEIRTRDEGGTMNGRDDLERRLDLAADLALRTRERIEAAVCAGEVPAWVVDACNVLERASVQYGELAERLRPGEPERLEPDPAGPAPMPRSLRLH
jgi:hypothetical protein